MIPLIIMNLLNILFVSCYLVVSMSLSYILYLMFSGPNYYNNIDLNILSDNQSPYDMYELNQKNSNYYYYDKTN